MATHSSVLAWRIPGTEEPSGLPSVGSHRVGHEWGDLAAAACVLNINFWSIEIYVRNIKNHLIQVKTRFLWVEMDYHRKNFKRIKNELRRRQKIDTIRLRWFLVVQYLECSSSLGLLETVIWGISTFYLEVFH